MNNNNKNLNRVMELLKAKHHPEQYAKEQQENESKLKETLAFVEGVLTQFYADKEAQEEVKKASIMFVSDPSSPCGFKPNKQS